MTYKIHPSKLLILSTVLTVLVEPFMAIAATSPTPNLIQSLQPDVFITEVQTATTTSASEEFIEFYNTTDHDIDFADSAHGGKDIWKLQYFSGSKLNDAGVIDWTKPTGSIDLWTMSNHVVSAHDYYLLAATKSDGSIYQPGGIEADGHYSAKFSDDIGLQLVDVVASTAVTTAHDRLTWRKAPANSELLNAPLADTSLQRIPNEDGEYVDADGKLVGFAVEPNITPRDLWLPPIIDTPDEPEQETDDEPALPTDTALGDSLKKPIITELLPNPATPKTDANDEFIELYNPNTTSFDLGGYVLETGTTTLHDFTFAAHTMLDPNAYTAFYSIDTHLSLSNSGGQVRLFDATKILQDESDSYPVAADGQAWALLDNAWQWSNTPTPGAANLPGTAGVQAGITGKSTKGKVKGANTIKTATKKVKSTIKKVKKAKKAKKTKKTKTKQAVNNLASVVKPTPIHSGVLATIAVAALLYALYEYRIDLANHLYRLRSHRSTRRKSRP